MKIDQSHSSFTIRVEYHYDVEDPETYAAHNRLLYYETWRIPDDMPEFGGPGGSEPMLLSTTWYYYNYAGNVRHVVTEKENPGPNPKFEATRLKYAQNGRAVTYVLGETWDQGPADYDITYAREFRYDSARQRYMNRVLDPDALEGGSRVPLSNVWSDYDGDEIYGDFEIDGQTITELRSFELGLGKVDPWTTVGGADTSYYHTDMIGTTRFMTDWTGADIDSAVYTAFGERISGTQHRYGYLGASGFEGAWSDDPGDPYLGFGSLHVNPYYDPSTGRTLQRNPAGIAGGLNVYAVSPGKSSVGVDADGLVQDEPNDPCELSSGTGESTGPSLGLEFNKEWADNFWSDLGKGTAATLDGLIPYFDPFQSLYDTGTDPGTKWSRRGGKVAYVLISGPRAILQVKNWIKMLRSPNPPPFTSPFPPMKRGPFYGGGKLWTGCLD